MNNESAINTEEESKKINEYVNEQAMEISQINEMAKKLEEINLADLKGMNINEINEIIESLISIDKDADGLYQAISEMVQSGSYDMDLVENFNAAYWPLKIELYDKTIEAGKIKTIITEKTAEQNQIINDAEAKVALGNKTIEELNKQKGLYQKNMVDINKEINNINAALNNNAGVPESTVDKLKDSIEKREQDLEDVRKKIMDVNRKLISAVKSVKDQMKTIEDARKVLEELNQGVNLTTDIKKPTIDEDKILKEDELDNKKTVEPTKKTPVEDDSQSLTDSNNKKTSSADSASTTPASDDKKKDDLENGVKAPIANGLPEGIDISQIKVVLNEEETMKDYRNSGYDQNANGWYFSPSENEYVMGYNPINDPLFRIYDYYKKEYEIDKEKTMQNYRNSGYDQNANGWYFSPSEDEYIMGYDPLNDPLFQEKVEKWVLVGRGRNDFGLEPQKKDPEPTPSPEPTPEPVPEPIPTPEPTPTPEPVPEPIDDKDMCTVKFIVPNFQEENHPDFEWKVIKVKKGEPALMTDIPNLPPEYKFNGWVDRLSQPFDLNTPVNEDLELHSSLEKLMKITFTYGSEDNKQQHIQYVEKGTILSKGFQQQLADLVDRPEFHKKTQEFRKWYLSGDSKQTKVDLNQPIDSDIELDAKYGFRWEKVAAVAAGVALGVSTKAFDTVIAPGLGEGISAAVAGLASGAVSYKLKNHKDVDYTIYDNQELKGVKKAKELMVNYFRRDKHIKDLNTFLRTFAITAGLTGAYSKFQASQVKANPTPSNTPSNTPQTNAPTNNIQAPTNTASVNTPNIGNGGTIGDFDPNSIKNVYDTASYAVNNVHAENPLMQYIGNGKIAEAFYGNTRIPLTENMSITDIMNAFKNAGVNVTDANKLAYNLVSPDGTPLSWISHDQLLEGLGSVAKTAGGMVR